MGGGIVRAGVWRCLRSPPNNGIHPTPNSAALTIYGSGRHGNSRAIHLRNSAIGREISFLRVSTNLGTEPGDPCCFAKSTKFALHDHSSFESVNLEGSPGLDRKADSSRQLFIASCSCEKSLTTAEPPATLTIRSKIKTQMSAYCMSAVVCHCPTCRT